MKIDVSKLKNNSIKNIQIDEEIILTDDFLKSNNILESRDIYFTGLLSNTMGYFIDGVLSGTLVLSSSVTLKPVEFPFEVEIVGSVAKMFEEIGENFNNYANTIDFLPIMCENILIEIPIRIVEENPNIKKNGDGWKIIDDNEVKLNPGLQKLNELLEK